MHVTQRRWRGGSFWPRVRKSTTQYY